MGKGVGVSGMVSYYNEPKNIKKEKKIMKIIMNIFYECDSNC